MKRIYSVVMAACVGLAAVAQMSPMMRARMAQAPSGERMSAFVKVDNAEAMRQSGVKIDMVLGDIALVSGDREALTRVSRLQGVRSMDAPRRVYLHCDSTLSYTHAGAVQAGTNLPMAYDGRGVVVGVIDCGIQYNHAAFKDVKGRTRISRVYFPSDTTSTVVAGGNTQRGREYTTAQEIGALTTDDASMDHGTHTTGIAAGSLVGKYSGMAPEAELVLVGIPGDDLTNDNVALGLNYIASYAASVGRPCVINMSLGSHDGPHDGTGYFPELMQELNQRYGTIFILSSGNEATDHPYLHKVLSENDKSLSTVMYCDNDNNAEVEVWSRGSSPLSVTYNVYNSYGRSIVSSTQPFTTDTVIDVSQVNELKNYFDGNITIAQGLGSNNRYYVRMSHSVSPKSYRYYLAFSINGNAGDEIEAWDANEESSFNSCYLSGYSDGTGEASYSDMATGDYCISVGAGVARNTYPVGSRTSSTYTTIGDMAYFSSYGTEPGGRVHPFVVAPGWYVVSSVSRYCCSKTYYSQNVGSDYWYVKSGTSMSAPAVTGIVALWLQACPSLTLEQVKEAIVNTSHLVPDGDPQRGANGDIDALAGLQYILEHYATTNLTCDVNADGVVDVSDVNAVINVMLGIEPASKYEGRADVNGDGSIDVTDVNMVINQMLGR